MWLLEKVEETKNPGGCGDETTAFSENKMLTLEEAHGGKESRNLRRSVEQIVFGIQFSPLDCYKLAV